MPKASNELLKLMKKTGFPCTQTLMGLGAYPMSDKQFLGMLAMHGTNEANMAMYNCDLMICVGARFDDRITGKVSGFSPNSKKIHLDIDASSFNKSVNVDHFIKKNKPVTTQLIVNTKKDELKIDQLNYKIYKNNKKIHIEEAYPYLSIYMTKIIKKIIFSRKCNLPNLKSVFSDHEIFIKEFEKNFSKTKKNGHLVIK